MFQTEKSNNNLFFCFLGVIACILINGFFRILPSHNIGLAVSFLTNLLLIGVIGFYVHENRNFVGYKKILNFIFSFNVVVLFVKAVFFDFYAEIFPINFYKSSFVFGHFADYFVLFNHDIIKNFELVKTGYFPFSLFIFKAFAKVFGLSDLGHHVGLLDILVYNLIFFAAYYFAIRLYFLRFASTTITPKFVYLFVLVSYIFSFGYERGNPSFFSFFLFSLFLLELLANQSNQSNQSQVKLNNGFLIFVATLLFSIKVVNLMFLYLIFRVKRELVLKVITSFLVFNFVFSMILVDFNAVLAGDLIVNALSASVHSSVNFSDANSVLGTSSYNAFYIGAKNVIHTISNDAFLIEPKIRTFFLLIGGFVLILYTVMTKADVVRDALVIILIPIFFHHSNADYNLQLLIPVFLYVLLTDLEGHYFNIMKYLSLLFLLVNLYPLAYITCCDVAGRMNSITLKSFIFPAVVLMVIILLLVDKRFLRRQ